MKKKLTLICGLVIGLATMMSVASCKKETQHCTSSKPYYCAGYNLCCPYPYLATGTHYCYQYKYECQSDGYYCVRCYTE